MTLKVKERAANTLLQEECEKKTCAKNTQVKNASKETTLERADFTLQLSMLVTAEKERELFIIFFLSSFCKLLSPQF